MSLNKQTEGILSLGEKVRKTREQSQLTQQQLAEDIMSKHIIDQIENNILIPSMEMLEHISYMVNQSIDYFLDNNRIDLLDTDKMMLENLFELYRNEEFKTVVWELDHHYDQNPMATKDTSLRDLYVSSCAKLSSVYKCSKNYEEAFFYYRKALIFERDLLLGKDMNLYYIYKGLCEVSLFLGKDKQASQYQKKAEYLLQKFQKAKYVKKILKYYANDNYDELLKEFKLINPKNELNKKRVSAITGLSYFYKEDYTKAAYHLESALDGDASKSCHGIQEMVLQHLNLCTLYSKQSEI